MHDHTKIVRLIDSTLAVLRHSQYVSDGELPKYSTTALFKAVLRLLPYGVVEGRMVNREYKPVGMGDYGKLVDYDEWPTRVTCTDGYLYDDSCPPWQSRADYQRYMFNLVSLRSYLNGPSAGTEYPLHLVPFTLAAKKGGHASYVRKTLRSLNKANPVQVSVRPGGSLEATTAMIHQIAGKGEVSTRRIDPSTIEVHAK